MPFLTSQWGKRLFSATIAFQFAAAVQAIPSRLASSTPSSPISFFYYPTWFLRHNSAIYPLYNGDTALLDNKMSRGRVTAAVGFVRKERNGDLVIALPEIGREKYRIRFFDEGNNFVFEIRQIRDPMLILEKYNFQHSGLFLYELYRENLLIERNTFLIRKD